MKPFFFAGVIFFMVSSAFATVADSVEALTGARTKVVWIEEYMPGSGNDWDAWGPSYCLKGFDTRGNNPGVSTTIVPGPANVPNPQFTPDGNHIIYSDFKAQQKIWMVNWDGTGKRELLDGYGLSLWKDPATKHVWLYFSQIWIADNWEQLGVKRVRLDDLSIVELVWDKTPINGRFRLSRDGRYAAAGNPWPAVSFIDLQGGTWNKITSGCNPQIAPDNSYRMLNFEDGNHREIAMWGPKGAGPKTMINVEFAGKGKDAWAPRFSTSKAEIFTANAPIGGPSDVFIAKFNADFTGFTSHVRVTTPNERQKTYAMAWIAEGPSIGLSSRDTLITASPGTTPAAVRLAISNTNPPGTLPALSATSDQIWLTAPTGGAGNSQHLDLQVGDFSALASGLHQATVTVTGQDVEPITCKVTLRVLSTPVATAVVISPSVTDVSPGLTLPFTAQVVDQFHDPMGGSVDWSVSSGGTISPAGLFTSDGTAGTFQVTATLASPALAGTATVVVTDIPRTNLALWLKADTGLTLNAAGGVTNWKDWSGAGRDAAATSTTFPQYVASGWNGMPAVNFDGDQNLSFTQIDMTYFTVCAVYRFEAASKPFHFWLAGPLQGLNAGGTFSGYTGWGAWNGVGGAWDWRLADATPVDWGQVTIFNHKLSRNGVPASSPANTTVLSMALSMLGSRPNADQGFVGDIAEVIVYDRTLTAAEQAKVEGYLRTRYNLSGPPVSAAPGREASALIAPGAPVLQGLQLRLPGSGVYAIDIFTPRGARVGSFQLKAPGTFDLSHAGLSNGLYQIRVRAGADIFWFKAPVVR